MSKYTTDINDILSNSELKDLLDDALNSYPIYKEEHRAELNEKILNHYMFREIGIIPASKFIFMLKRKMMEIMPYYNQLYKTEDIEFNPLYNIDITETFEHETKGTSTESNSSNNNTNVNQTTTNTGDNLQKHIENGFNGITDEQLKNNSFINSADYIEDNNSTSQNGTSTNEIIGNSQNDSTHNENYIKKTLGSSAGLPFSKAIKQYRDIILNIDMKIIEELEELFLQIW